MCSSSHPLSCCFIFSTPYIRNSYASRLLGGEFMNPRAGQNDDQAHPPITPCKAVDPATISDPTQRGVYTLVVKHYLACCSRDALGKETSITVNMASEQFTATGLMILEHNWLEIYAPWERWSTGAGELPRVDVGSRITPSALLMKDGRTTPPQPLTEVELISLMDRNKIGTDATIAQHISTIQEREYATKDAAQRFSPTKLGIALVEGYNCMGYQLNKPDLRREMERECNLVANRQKSMDDIVGPILAKMRQCFVTARAEAHKLDQAMARHFPRLGASNDMTVVQASFSQCGVCSNMMALKQGPVNNNNNRLPRKLLFCNTCQTGHTLPRGLPRPKTEQENGGPAVKCPICNFQVVQIVHGDGYEGNGYHVCPKCFSDPPADHGGALNTSEFRCFSCAHPTCTLAGGTQGGDVEVFACPFCEQKPNGSGKVSLRKNSRGYVLSCSNYSGHDRCAYTIWLPRESQAVTIPEGDENVCPRCSTTSPVRKVSFVWKPGSVPPHLGRSCSVCVLCDVGFREEMHVSLPQPNQVMTNPRRTNLGGGGRGGGMTNGSVGRGGGRTNVRGGLGGGNARNDEGRAGRGTRVAPAIYTRNNNNVQTGLSGGNVCYRCNQPGHFANNCPNR
jgi:DNA topoisomerase III